MGVRAYRPPIKRTGGALPRLLDYWRWAGGPPRAQPGSGLHPDGPEAYPLCALWKHDRVGACARAAPYRAAGPHAARCPLGPAVHGVCRRCRSGAAPGATHLRGVQVGGGGLGARLGGEGKHGSACLCAPAEKRRCCRRRRCCGCRTRRSPVGAAVSRDEEAWRLEKRLRATCCAMLRARHQQALLPVGRRRAAWRGRRGGLSAAGSRQRTPGFDSVVSRRFQALAGGSASGRPGDRQRRTRGTDRNSRRLCRLCLHPARLAPPAVAGDGASAVGQSPGRGAIMPTRGPPAAAERAGPSPALAARLLAAGGGDWSPSVLGFPSLWGATASAGSGDHAAAELAFPWTRTGAGQNPQPNAPVETP